MMRTSHQGDNTGSSIIAGKIPLLQIPKGSEKERDPAVVASHILAYYYSGLANLFCQTCLPCAEEESGTVAEAIIKASHDDFRMLDSWLEACDPDEIGASPNSNLYKQIRDTWREQVKDWTTVLTSSSSFEAQSAGAGDSL